MRARRLSCLCSFLFLSVLSGLIYLQYSGIETSTRWNAIMTMIRNIPFSSGGKNPFALHVTLRNMTKIKSSKPIFPHPYRFFIKNPDLCTRGFDPKKGRLSLVILVCSSLNNTEERRTIRETWGSVVKKLDFEGLVRLGFLLGHSRNETIQRIIVKESVVHEDIIQGNFVDSYKNLTLKSVMLLKWVSEFCLNANFFLKTDDDMYINIPKLLAILSKLRPTEDAIYGVLFRKSRPNRDPWAKWYVPESQFEGTMYPEYLSGTGYLMTRDVIPKLYRASFGLPFLGMEDIFITGQCAEAANVRRMHLYGFSYFQRKSTGCAFTHAITGHYVTPEDMRKIWNELQNENRKCEQYFYFWNAGHSLCKMGYLGPIIIILVGCWIFFILFVS